jgi:DNA invertase Pin-like site-specific DNA recombinase
MFKALRRLRWCWRTTSKASSNRVSALEDSSVSRSSNWNKALRLDVAVSGRRQGRPQLDVLMQDARDHAFDCVLVWKFDRFARSTKHLLTALEEFNHLGIRFVSVQDRIDTTSPMGKAMFTLIGAMAELESSLISERVSAGIKAARARGKHLGRPRTPTTVVAKIEELARTTDLSVRDIHRSIGAKTGRGVVGDIVKRIRHGPKLDAALR